MTRRVLAAVMFAVVTPVASADDPASPEVFFEDRVEGLLLDRCVDCHMTDAAEGGLDLSTAAAVLRGSDSGSVVTAGDPEKSLLYEVVHSGEMPPDGPELDEETVDQIKAWIASGAKFRDPPPTAGPAVDGHDVIPILLLRCATCHGAELQRGGLDLRTLASLRRGGDGGPVAVSGAANESPLIERVEQELCPPQGQLLKYFVERPSTTEVATLRRWIDAGMPDAKDPNPGDRTDADSPDDPPTRPASTRAPRLIGRSGRFHGTSRSRRSRPTWKARRTMVTHDDGDPHPVDAFIGRKLREHGLTFSPPASRSELIRRVHFDLVGLPPSEDELERWERDPGDDWYERMVDALLASPRYGERWGRYWLDVAGYADSEGGQSADTVRQFAWKYRDYVVRSFNEDKPWDRFLHEQLAGDELAEFRDPDQVTESVVDNLTGTGFLRMTVDETGSRTMNFVPERLGLISDVLGVVSSGVMGVTMECARCHSHKYDPISQSDYFRFKAIFQGVFDEHDWMSWKQRRLDVASPEMAARRESNNRAIESQVKELRSRRTSLVRSWQDRYYDREWAKLEESVQEEITVARKARDGRRTLRQDKLVRRYDTEIRPTEEVLVERHPELGEELRGLDGRIAALEERLEPEPTIRAAWDRGRPSPTYVLIRGEYDRPGRPVDPGIPAALSAGESPFRVEPPWPGAESSGRRLAFARWLTSPEHPLTARVLVNRVWSDHFGRGIVETLDNFGAMGAEPTHPELLDWLARDFVDGGWSLKSLHRTMLLSRTYRQSSVRTPETDEVDPENELLGRMRLRRLDAEAVRDSLIALAGRLDPRAGGPPSPIVAREDGLIMEQPSHRGTYRRSLYLQLRRTEMPTLLTVFDYPEMQPNCSDRAVSTVSTQSLVLVNNARVHEWAGDFADRVLRQIPGDSDEGDSDEADSDKTDRQRLRLVYRMAFSRSPRPDEVDVGAESLRRLDELWRQSGRDADEASREALVTFCHTILNSAEFLYVD